METYLYTCKHCYKEFRPTRRVVQKFCSDSCRVGHHQYNKRVKQKNSDSLIKRDEFSKALEELKKKKREEKKKEEGRSEGMSLAGIGNAAAGTVIVDTVMNMFTKEHNKPATKGDLLDLRNHVSRYRRIENMKPNLIEQKPYLDLETGKVIYK